MEALLVFIAIGTGAFFAIRFHAQGRGWVWGLLYGLFLCPIALVHALIIAITALSARDEMSYTDTGIKHMASGEYDKAISDFDRAIEINPHDSRIYAVRGQTFALQSMHEMAIPDFNRAIEIMNDEDARIERHNPYPYLHRGIAWTHLNEYDRAIEDFTKAIASRPEPEAYLERGRVFSELKEYNRALEDYEEAISLNPNAEAYLARGRTHLNLGEHDKALNDFAIALRLDQVNPNMLIETAAAHYAKGDLKKAIDELSVGISMVPDFMEMNDDVLRELKQEEQLEIYDEVINDLSGLYGARGVCFLNVGEYRKAIEDFDGAISLNPNNASFYRGRGSSYSQTSEHSRAVEDLDIAVNLDPDDANTHFSRGIVHFNKTDFVSGVRDFDKAIALERGHVDSYTGRGRCFLHLGDYGKAISDLDIAISLEDEKVVVPDMKNTVNISLDSSYAYAIRGLAYSMLGREAAAKRDFNKAAALGYDYSKIEEDLRELKEQSNNATTEYQLPPPLEQTVFIKRDRDKKSIDRNSELSKQHSNVSAQIKHPIALEKELKSELQQAVLKILTDNLRSGSSEAENPNKQHLPAQAVSNATLDSLRAFIEIHEAISAIVGPGHYRTRHAGRTSTEGYGLAYYTRPMGDGPRARGKEIQSILLPTKANMRGCIEAYFRGHDASPISTPLIHNNRVGDVIIDGRPAFRIIGRPSTQLTEQIIYASRISSLHSQIQSD